LVGVGEESERAREGGSKGGRERGSKGFRNTYGKYESYFTYSLSLSLSKSKTVAWVRP
jgi:hypothetical protein